LNDTIGKLRWRYLVPQILRTFLRKRRLMPPCPELMSARLGRCGTDFITVSSVTTSGYSNATPI
jgi:hypothetical protein